MPITRSATKAHRQSLRRRTVNLRVKRSYREAVKELRKATRRKGEKARRLTAGKKGVAPRSSSSPKKLQEELMGKLAKAYSEIDKAAKKGVIHKNKAVRLKSRLAKSIG